MAPSRHSSIRDRIESGPGKGAIQGYQECCDDGSNGGGVDDHGGPRPMRQSTMLLISDDPDLIGATKGLVGEIDGLELAVVAGSDEARSYPDWDGVALVMIHQRGEGPTARVERLLRVIASARRSVATLVLADRHDADQGLALLRLGVADYIGRPVDPGRLSYLIESLTLRARGADGGRISPPTRGPIDAAGVAGDSDEFADLMEQVRRVALQDATILIGGEAGTGKTRLAGQIHRLSSRRDGPFVAIDCRKAPTAAIEDDLFGHARGAFPGADRDRPGKLAGVGRGTLFLDDIDALPPTTQVRLLRAIEDRAFRPIGSDRVEPMVGRLIAASARSLEIEVAEGRFRSDLFYRLHVVTFDLPPLRDRRGEVGPLAHRLVAEAADRMRRPVGSIGPDALRTLEGHDWPGNVRELRDAIEQAVARCPGAVILREHLPASVLEQGADPTPSRPSPAHRSSFAQLKGDVELARITEALEKHGNNRLRAASELGISRMTLYKKLYKYGIMQHST